MKQERPINPAGNLRPEWGSDVFALALRNLGLKYISLNPGASYRGLHDSLVNFLGNESPQLVLCLHEEHAVAIAHAYAKVTGEPMAVALHSNVGLMHGSMGIFDAWCDRVPVIVLGATGPVDAASRRPWIDWIHTAQDQGALIRDFTKWDDQPGSVEAAVESIYRANLIARTAPYGPVYVCFDVMLQEKKLDGEVRVPDAVRFGPAGAQQPDPDSVQGAAEALSGARNPLILAGRVSRRQDAWDQRVELAERLGARVLTDHKAGAAFPTSHALHAAAPMTFMSPEARATLEQSDVILALDWIDLAGTLNQVWAPGKAKATIINATLDVHNHRAWSMDYQGLAPTDIRLLAEPDAAVAALLGALGDSAPRPPAAVAQKTPAVEWPEHDGDLAVGDIAHALRHAIKDDPVSFIRLPGGWPHGVIEFLGPLDYLGSDGGGGIGSGPGMAVGGALALKDTGRLAVAVLGDGDFLMGVNAFWTAAHYELPLLVVVSNNRSYFNDEMHQETVARDRGRDPANRWIGQRIADPEPDLAKLAEAQGLAGIGPVTTRGDLRDAMAKAVGIVRAGGACVVDVHVTPAPRQVAKRPGTGK